MTLQNQHLNLEASKAISEPGVEMSCNLQWYNEFFPRSDLEGWSDKEEWSLGQNRWVNDGRHKTYPAPSLHELLTLLPQIGEKCGWPKRTDNTFDAEMECYEAHAHHILDIILAGGTMDKEVSKYLLEIIKKVCPPYKKHEKR